VDPEILLTVWQARSYRAAIAKPSFLRQRTYFGLPFATSRGISTFGQFGVED
jgi:hypothetical protein